MREYSSERKMTIHYAQYTNVHTYLNDDSILLSPEKLPTVL